MSDKRPADHRINLTRLERLKIDELLGSHDRATRQEAIRIFITNLDTKENLNLDHELKKARLRKVNLESDLLQRKLSYENNFNQEPTPKASLAIHAAHRNSYVVCTHTFCNASFNKATPHESYTEYENHYKTRHSQELNPIEAINMREALGC